MPHLQCGCRPFDPGQLQEKNDDWEDNVSFKKNLKCIVGSVLVVAPLYLIFDGIPVWSLSLTSIVVYFQLCIVSDLNEIKKDVEAVSHDVC